MLCRAFGSNGFFPLFPYYFNNDFLGDNKMEPTQGLSTFDMLKDNFSIGIINNYDGWGLQMSFTMTFFLIIMVFTYFTLKRRLTKNKS